jgi:hypothetical protein
MRKFVKAELLPTVEYHIISCRCATLAPASFHFAGLVFF